MNQQPIKVTITQPAGRHPLIEYGRHFNVRGEIVSDAPLPDDAVLTVYLFDNEGRLLRHVRQDRKNNRNLYIDHPDLTTYPKEMDPEREGIFTFGFPELMVKDPAHPMDSFRDATIKCWYSDQCYKAVIASGTGVAQGRIFDDGVGLVDEKNDPYPMLQMGVYRLKTRLTTSRGEILATAEKEIRIGKRDSQTIVRFNPTEHKEKMIAWCQQMHFGIDSEALPGYLDP